MKARDIYSKHFRKTEQLISYDISIAKPDKTVKIPIKCYIFLKWVQEVQKLLQ